MKSKRLLSFLALLFLFSLFYAYIQMPQQDRVSSVNINKNQNNEGVVPQSSTKDVYPYLRSDLLERKSQPYPGVRRDLFFSGLPAGQHEEIVSAVPDEPPVVIEPAVVPPPPPPPPPPAPSSQDVARQEIAQYKFIGFLKKGDKQTVFLSSSGEVFLVRKGDYLGRDPKYYVLNVTDTTLELRKAGVGDFSIKLSEQESLSAVSLRTQSKQEPAPPSIHPDQEMDLQDQPEFQTIPDEEQKTGD